MSQFILPGGLALATGTLLTTINGVQSSSKSEPYASQDSPGTCPDWTIIKTGMKVPCDLIAPKSYIDLSVINMKNIPIEPPIYQANYQTHCKIKVDPTIKNEDIEVVVYTNEGNLYFVICYENGEPANATEREISFTYSVETTNPSSVYPKVEVYLYQEDPRTSRGTVTTVLVSRPAPSGELVSQED